MLGGRWLFWYALETGTSRNVNIEVWETGHDCGLVDGGTGLRYIKVGVLPRHAQVFGGVYKAAGFGEIDNRCNIDIGGIAGGRAKEVGDVL